MASSPASSKPNFRHRAFDATFEEVRQFFGPFTAEAMEQSSFLIDRIVERA